MTRESPAVEPLSASALELNLRALRPILSDPEVTELALTRSKYSGNAAFTSLLIAARFFSVSSSSGRTL